MSREHILVIEDHDLDRKLVVDLLAFEGYTVLEAADARQGLTLAAEHQPALIFMDIQLYDGDGLSTLQRLRANPATAAIPVIALTAMAMQGDRERLLAAGFNEYCAKPIDIDEFSALVRRFCQGVLEEELNGSTAEDPCRR
jgi:CheY-like chemotaxis protein